MKFIKVSISILLIISCASLFFGCSEDDKGNNSNNRAPMITGLTATPDSMGVDLEETSTLSVTASDQDGDALIITWDASAGDLSTLTGSTTIWTAPAEVLPSVVTVSVSDGDLTAAESYTFYYNDFAALIGTPTIDSVHVVPGIARVVSPSTQIKRWLNMYARVPLDLTAENTITWLTVEASNGNVYYLKDDGTSPDITADDNQYSAIKGGNTMVIDLMEMPFIAYNKYAKSDTMLFDLNFILSEDELPTFIYPDSASGTGRIVADDILAYFDGQPEFRWNAYPNADYFEVALTDTAYHFEIGQDESLIFWMPPPVPGTDTSIVYNYDNSAVPSLFQLSDYGVTEEEYLLHLTAYVDGAWARREARVRKVN